MFFFLIVGTTDFALNGGVVLYKLAMIILHFKLHMALEKHFSFLNQNFQKLVTGWI